MAEFRIEKDSMGEIKVPKDALYAAQTQRAVNNFPISGIPIPRGLIRALGLIKKVAADLCLAKVEYRDFVVVCLIMGLTIIDVHHLYLIKQGLTVDTQLFDKGVA